jgi:SAM-dependent methyltransferase
MRDPNSHKSLRQYVNMALLKLSNSTLRKARIRRFIARLFPANGMTILDLGGWDGQLLSQITNISGIRGGRYIVADIDSHVRVASTNYGFEAVVLKEGQPLPFDNGEVDIVWCNSVIEHITPNDEEACIRPGIVGNREWRSRSFELQRAFASEISRISKSYFVQTPARAFPIESHTAIPFGSYLGHNSMVSVAASIKRIWPRPIGYVDWNLLSAHEMKALFPDAIIELEKILGIPKSIIAWKRTEN